jgi:hypothetical protein
MAKKAIAKMSAVGSKSGLNHLIRAVYNDADDADEAGSTCNESEGDGEDELSEGERELLKEAKAGKNVMGTAKEDDDPVVEETKSQTTGEYQLRCPKLRLTQIPLPQIDEVDATARVAADTIKCQLEVQGWVDEVVLGVMLTQIVFLSKAEVKCQCGPLPWTETRMTLHVF